jgi:hypothetical protein
MKAAANRAMNPQIEKMASNVNLRTLRFTLPDPFFVASVKKIAPPTGESAAGLFPREALTIDAFLIQRSSPKLRPHPEGRPRQEILRQTEHIVESKAGYRGCGPAARETNACQRGRADS